MRLEVEMAKKLIKEELINTILEEIDTLLTRGVLPVSNDHLKHISEPDDILAYLVAMKSKGLISGDLITISTSGAPHRMTKIRLTYAGIRALRQ